MANLVHGEPRLIATDEIIALARAGRLPALPKRIESLNFARRRRLPSEAEFASYQWFGVGDPLVGLMCSRVEFDLHTNADVIAVDYIAGPLAAVRSLLALVGRMCDETGMEAVGAIDVGNPAMARILTNAGFACTRLVFSGSGLPRG